jgi:hypothetical protein
VFRPPQAVSADANTPRAHLLALVLLPLVPVIAAAGYLAERYGTAVRGRFE